MRKKIWLIAAVSAVLVAAGSPSAFAKRPIVYYGYPATTVGHPATAGTAGAGFPFWQLLTNIGLPILQSEFGQFNLGKSMTISDLIKQIVAELQPKSNDDSSLLVAKNDPSSNTETQGTIEDVNKRIDRLNTLLKITDNDRKVAPPVTQSTPNLTPTADDPLPADVRSSDGPLTARVSAADPTTGHADTAKVGKPPQFPGQPGSWTTITVDGEEITVYVPKRAADKLTSGKQLKSTAPN
jgi:hypothetical protein